MGMSKIYLDPSSLEIFMNRYLEYIESAVEKVSKAHHVKDSGSQNDI